jgi:hypothetical protein
VAGEAVARQQRGNRQQPERDNGEKNEAPRDAAQLEAGHGVGRGYGELKRHGHIGRGGAAVSVAVALLDASGRVLLVSLHFRTRRWT